MEKEYSVCDFCLTDLNKLPATEAALAKANAEVERLTKALEFVASNVVWVDEKNQKITLTYAMGTVDVARKALSEVQK
jgi:hypothetical protein